MTKVKDLQRNVRAKDREIRQLNERIQDLLQANPNTKLAQPRGSKSTASRNGMPKRYSRFVEDSHLDISDLND